MTVTIAVLNRKGGVGKTSVTKDLAYALVASGQRVLQVGLDPQSSLEVVAGLGFDTPAARTVARVLMPEEFADAGGLDDVVHSTPWAADLIPASKALATAERALGEPGRGGANRRLARGLERLSVADRYDVVLLDCPPGMTSLTMNALVAASRVLVPTPLDFLSVAGLAVLMETVEEVREYDNPGAAVSRHRRHTGRRADTPHTRGAPAARAAVRRGGRRNLVSQLDPAHHARARRPRRRFGGRPVRSRPRREPGLPRAGRRGRRPRAARGTTRGVAMSAPSKRTRRRAGGRRPV